MTTQYESLLTYCSENGRVCPLPMFWNKLYAKLPNKTKIGNGWNPPMPLILAAWDFSGDDDKAVRFKEHLVWAKENNYLNEAESYLRKLNEEDWHYSSHESER